MKNRHILPVVLLLFSCSAIATESTTQPPFEHSHTRQHVEGHFHLVYEDKYVSEGRDTLAGDNLLASSLEFGWQHLSSRFWYGESLGQDYKELQLTVGIKEAINNTEFYIEYTYLRFPTEKQHDNELGIGIEWSELPLELAFAIDGYHSFEAQGSFWELSLKRDFQVSDQLTLASMTNLGINSGYVTDGHNGANHLALSVEGKYNVSKSFSVKTHAGYSWALKVKPELSGDESLVDTFHGGVNLQWSF